MPEPLPEQFANSTLTILSEPALFEYCKSQGRVLPRFLKSRLQGGPPGSSNLTAPGEGRSLFAAFLDVNADIEGDPEFDIFFRYLSGEEWQGYDIDDLISLTRRPSELFQRLAKEPCTEEICGLDMALHGFRLFLIFCHRFDSLLRTCSPILRSALWHCHFEKFNRLSERIRDCTGRILDNFSTWADATKSQILPIDDPSGLSSEESLMSWEESFDSLEKLRCTIWRLTSNLYGEPLWKLASDFDQ
jgi:hypothetical protein